jgi:hypothetical protein
LDLQLSIFGLIVLVTCCIAAGVVSAVVHTWALRAHAYSLEDRVSILEGTVSREVKVRAAQERWKKPDRDAELIANLQPQQPAKKLNFWETSHPRSVSK